MKKLKGLGLAAGLFFFLSAGNAQAASATIGLDVMNGSTARLAPGVEFYVLLYITPGTTSTVGDYYATISYDRNLLEVLRAEKIGPNSQIYRPTLYIATTSGYISVTDTNIYQTISSSCQNVTGRMDLTRIWFKVKSTATLGVNTNLNITYSTAHECGSGSQGRGFSPISNVNEVVGTVNYVENTYNLQQYLDLNADWLLGESDVDFLKDLVTKAKLNVADPNQVKLGGIQMDFRAHARVNIYDLGISDAVARPTRFIRSGTDGICNTTRAGDDVQELTVGRGLPYAIAISPGPNNVINSPRSGDDTSYGMFITTGPDGIAQSSALGDDVQTISVGRGEANSICVSAGPNGKIDTTVSGDDTSYEASKATSTILQTKYVPPGRPARVKVLFPPYGLLYTPHEADVPIIVQVQDEYGNPKSGIAPTFNITSGNGRFTYGGGYVSTIAGQPGDKYLTLGQSPEGVSVANLHVFSGTHNSTMVNVSVAADPDKGITTAFSKNVEVIANNYVNTYPASIDIWTASGATVQVGEQLNTTYSVYDQYHTPEPGWCSRTKLLTDRNMPYGRVADIEGERGIPIFFDNFSGTLGGWTVYSNPAGGVTIDHANNGWFEPSAVKFGGSRWYYTYIYKKAVQTQNYEGQIRLGFQWKYASSNNNYLGSMKIYFWDTGHSQWVLMKEYSGSTTLAAARDRWLWEEFDLSGNPSLRTPFYFYITCETYDNEYFYIDNIGMNGFLTVFYEDFEDGTPGSTHYGLTNLNQAGYINTGRDGIRNSATRGDDAQTILINQGKPYSYCIAPGGNKTRDTSPAGDDTISGAYITTGPNGICNTHAAGDDFHIIPYGRGEPFQVAIVPGPDDVLQSTASGDDELFNSNGPNPNLIVKSGSGTDCVDNVPYCQYLLLGRSVSSPGNIANYMVQKSFFMGSYRYAYLSFYSKTNLLSDPSQNPRQEFVCEVSDDGGHTWVPVWDFDGVDHDWTYHRIRLHGDPRFKLNNNFLVRWRASMDYTESSDAAYIDEIKIYASTGEPDYPAFPTYDLGNGQYSSGLVTLVPGNFKVAVVYVPEELDHVAGDALLISDTPSVSALSGTVDPRTVKLSPDNFTINACERVRYRVIGKKVGQSKYSDLTKLYILDINGPARQTQDGGTYYIQAECSTGGNQDSYYIKMTPLSPGLEDPEGGGAGQQTGVLSGKVLTPSYTNAADAPVILEMGANSKIYTKTDANGFYMLASVPVGSNYTVKAMKSGYKLASKTAVNISSGANTSINIKLNSGADCDGDGVLDTADTDDDSDGSADTQEDSRGTNKCNPDSDGDGVPDNIDAFPTNAGETQDTDGDGIGDNTDSDDDGDGLSDYEENNLGADGYITDPLNPDTDGGGLNDYQEYVQSRNPLDAADDVLKVSVETGATTWGFPLYTYYHDARTQVIYLGSEINMGGTINSMSLNVTTIPGQTMNNFTIRMKHTTMSAYPGSPAWESSGWTTVYQANTTISSTGWYTFTFTTPFTYNGSDNLLVDFSFNNSSWTSPGVVRASQPGGNRSIYYYTDSGYGDPLTWSGTSNPTPYVSTKVPDFRFDINPGDSDNDGLNDALENQLGTNRLLSDSDGDGLSDYNEVNLYHSNPTSNDSDSDLVLDNVEYSHACADPLIERWLHSDVDGDGLTDGQEDADRDGVLDSGETDPCNWDTDADGMSDGWEVSKGLNPRLNDAALDPDYDTLTNISEYINNTNPFNADTDQGGESDASEIAGGRNPNSASDDQPSVSIGDGSTSWNFPLYTYYHDARTQVIYLASEIKSGGSIKSLALNVTTIPGQTMNNFTIRMKHTTMSAYPGSPAWESSGWTTVYQANTTISSTGWYTFTFTTPFTYNGTDNLLIDFSFNNSSWTSAGIVRASQPGGNRSIYYYTDSGYGDPLTWSGTSNPTPILSNKLMDIRMVIISADSDGDGLKDSIENMLGTNRLDMDTDDDGLNDGQEVTVYFTDPLDKDTDNDHMPDGWEVSYTLNPLLASDASSDPDSDGRRNLDEYLRGFNPGIAEPGCGEGTYCFADTNGNGTVDVPDHTGLGSLIQNPGMSFSGVYPQNGDNLDLNGNGSIDVPDYSLMASLVSGSLVGELAGQADSVHLQTSLTPTISVGQGTTITVDLPSSAAQGARPRAGYGVIFYVTGSSGGGAGQFWGGDGSSSSYPGGRYCITGRINEDGGSASIWFLATHTGTVTIQAIAPASTGKHTKQVQLSSPVVVTIN